jgi:hypothetical protein
MTLRRDPSGTPNASQETCTLHGPGNDPRTRRFSRKAKEAAIIIGVANQEERVCALCVGSGEHRFHKRLAKAFALRRGCHGNRTNKGESGQRAFMREGYWPALDTPEQSCAFNRRKAKSGQKRNPGAHPVGRARLAVDTKRSIKQRFNRFRFNLTEGDHFYHGGPRV